MKTLWYCPVQNQFFIFSGYNLHADFYSSVGGYIDKTGAKYSMGVIETTDPEEYGLIKVGKL